MLFKVTANIENRVLCRPCVAVTASSTITSNWVQGGQKFLHSKNSPVGETPDSVSADVFSVLLVA